MRTSFQVHLQSYGKNYLLALVAIAMLALIALGDCAYTADNYGGDHAASLTNCPGATCRDLTDED